MREKYEGKKTLFSVEGCWKGCRQSVLARIGLFSLRCQRDVMMAAQLSIAAGLDRLQEVNSVFVNALKGTECLFCC